MTSLLGFDLATMNVPPFLAATRIAFVALTLVAVVMLIRRPDDRRAGRLVLGIAIAGHLLAWFATMAPLPNVYGANGSQDRENHLGWANMVAEGFSPLYTFQVNHLHFEPLWPLLTAAASGFDVDRVPIVFQWAPLVVGLLSVLSVRLVWAHCVEDREGRGVQAAFAALGALLLMAAPGDFTGPFRNPWALTFLLKPNHALGLALAPLAALALARSNSWKSRLFAGFVLQLIGWAFVIHMALFVAGLVVFVALSCLTKRADWKKDLIDSGTAVGANLLLVSPYLVMLFAAYPLFQASQAVRISPLSERPLEAPLRMGALLLVSGLGAWRTYRTGGRLGRVLASQWLGAQLSWQLFPILGLIGQAREQDEFFYWCRFWTGLFAGAGVFTLVWDSLGRFRVGHDQPGPKRASTATAISLVVLLPSLLPAWWDPLVMDQYFVAAQKPLPTWIVEPARFIRMQTPREAVFAGDRGYARWIAAYGARRVLSASSLNSPNDNHRRAEVGAALFGNGPRALMLEGLDRYSIQYILATSDSVDRAKDLALDELATRPYLDRVYDHEFEGRRVLIFKIRYEALRP